MRDYSRKGWRAYKIKSMLSVGYRKLSDLEKKMNIEILCIKDIVYVRPNYKHDK